MIIGIPKEIKPYENRVGLIPQYVKQLVEEGHNILVQENAGIKSGFSDKDYKDLGAEILPSIEGIYKKSDLIIKIKEPQEKEIPLIREKQIVFSYFHLPSNQRLVEQLLESKCIAVTYETLETEDHRLPLLIPMSAIAGKLAVQVGMRHLESVSEGKGVLLGGVAGVHPGHVVILGGGEVGTNACYVASGLRADVTLLDVNLKRLRELYDIMPNNVKLLYSSKANLTEVLRKADLVVAAVHLTGRKAPKLITREMLSLMEENTVIVDVAIDQGGCIETSRPTTHKEPTYKVDGIIHYCVANIPSIVPRTASPVLSHSSLPYLRIMANLGIEKGIQVNREIRSAISLWDGVITDQNLADTFEMDYKNIDDLIH